MHSRKERAMKMIRDTLMSSPVRRLAVAIAVASAGAAVAGAVVLAERPGHIDPRMARAAEPFAGSAAIAAVADPSLPAAADVVGTAPERGDEAPSTF
jgi:hypothetical protein